MQNAPYIAYISFGSNTGNSQVLLDEALKRIAALPEMELAALSSRYRTEPQEDKNQPWFFNQVAAFYSSLTPSDLLLALQKIETDLGRVRERDRRYGPRAIDLDILIYQERAEKEGGILEICQPGLTLPHPRLRRRAFVLVPLVEIAGKTSKALCNDLQAALDKLDYRLSGDLIFQK